MNTILAIVFQFISLFQPAMPISTSSVESTLVYPTTTTVPTPSVTPTNSPTPTATIRPTAKPTHTPQNSLLSAVNKFRKSNNNAPLVSDSLLCKIAKERVQALVHRGSLDNHEGYPAYHGIISAAFTQWWETLFYGSPPKTSESIVTSHWANSPGHRNSLLSSATHGCGAEQNGYAVFELGKK